MGATESAVASTRFRGDPHCCSIFFFYYVAPPRACSRCFDVVVAVVIVLDFRRYASWCDSYACIVVVVLAFDTIVTVLSFKVAHALREGRSSCSRRYAPPEQYHHYCVAQYNMSGILHSTSIVVVLRGIVGVGLTARNPGTVFIIERKRPSKRPLSLILSCNDRLVQGGTRLPSTCQTNNS